jgi:FkbM family methyltransferase
MLVRYRSKPLPLRSRRDVAQAQSAGTVGSCCSQAPVNCKTASVDIRTLKESFHARLHRLGFDVVPFSGAYFPQKFRVETMARLGIDVVVDVGANRGQFVDEIRAAGWHGDVVSVEPVRAVYVELESRAARDPKWQTVQAAMGEVTEPRSLNISENTWSSSLLPIADAHLRAAPTARYVGEETVMMRELDAVLSDLGLLDGRILYLKADTQGYELGVLKGAANAINTCAAIELELSLLTLYDGQPLVREVIQYLLELGFVAVSMAPSFSSEGRVLQMNGIFERVAEQRGRLSSGGDGPGPPI